MRWLSCATLALGAVAVASAGTTVPSSSKAIAPLKNDNGAIGVRGGGLGRDIHSAASKLTPGTARVMTLRTSLRYKAGIIGETGLLLGLLSLARRFVWRVRLEKGLSTAALDYGVWALIIFGSDGLLTLLNKAAVKLNLAQPRADLKQSLDTWYRGMAKPSWTPQDWVFPAVWIPLKTLQVLAARIVWVACGRDVLATPIVLFVLHIAYGDHWNAAFFREHYVKGALSTIVQFFVVLLATTKSFADVDKVASQFLLPTSAWLVVATALNASFYRKNELHTS